jgi:iron complex outermembrane receptor protein
MHAAGVREGIAMQFARMAGAALSVAAFGSYAADLPLSVAPEVVVTATRFEQKRDEFPIGVTVIQREAIERSTATTVIDLLSQQAGIQIRDSTGGPDAQIDLRGFGQTGDLNTAVLIDGQRYNDIDTSPVKWSSIPLSAVERIEILPGSGAVLYGSGATGGVINIITRRPQAGDRGAEARAGLGSYDATDLQGSLTLAGDNVGMRVHAADFRSDGYRDNNRLVQRNLLADLRTLGRDHVYAKLGVERQDLRNPGQLTLAELAANRRQSLTPLDFSSRDGARVDLGGSLKAGAAELAANLAWRNQENRAFFGSFGSDVRNELDSVAFSPRVKLAHRLGGYGHTLVGGVDIEEGTLDRNVTGTFFSGQTRAEQRKQGIYLQNNSMLDDGWLLTLGARLQRADTGRQDTPGAAIGKDDKLHASEVALRKQVAPGLGLYGKVGRSFRLPSVEEINFTTTTILEPQTSVDKELGAEYRDARARARLSLYRIDLENEIGFNPVLFDNFNFEPTRREGMELDTTVRPTERLELFANYARVLARFRGGEFAGNQVPLVPRNAFNAGASWLAGPKTRLAASVRYVGEQRYINDEANLLAARIPAYTVVDLKVMHQAGRWLFEAGVRNLLDEQYYTQGGVSGLGVIRVFPAPERNGYVTARYTFM